MTLVTDDCRKSTLAYRLKADFVADSNLFDQAPYGLFMILSNDFQVTRYS